GARGCCPPAPRRPPHAVAGTCAATASPPRRRRRSWWGTSCGCAAAAASASWWSPGSSPPGWALRSRAPPTRTTAPSRRPSWPRHPRDGSAGPAGPPSASGGSGTGCAGGTPRSGRIPTAAADRALGPRQHSACVQQHLLTVRAEALQEMPFDRYDSRNGSVGEQPLTDRGEVGALPDEPLHDGLRADLPCPALALVPALPGGEHVHLL